VTIVAACCVDATGSPPRSRPPAPVDLVETEQFSAFVSPAFEVERMARLRSRQWTRRPRSSRWLL